MSDREDRKKKLWIAGRESSREADRITEPELSALKKSISRDASALRPQIPANQEEIYNALIREVNESTSRNESIAALKTRIESLGPEAAALAKRLSILLV